MSIAEISRQTHLSQSVIDEIEHDNYAACGGNDRARAYIVAIARALDVDSGPLIEAYDAAQRPAEWIVATSPEPILAAQTPETLTPRADPELVTADADTQPITMGQPMEEVMTGDPARHLTVSGSPYPVTTAGIGIPAVASGPAEMAYADRHPFLWLALGGALLAAIALGGFLLVVGKSGHATRPAVTAGHRVGGRGPARLARTHPMPRGHSARKPGRSRPASPPGSRRVQTIVPATIAAFGPGGTGQGDSPQLARQALAGKPAAPWHSAWYTTPQFGNLQPGTGLLLDMGRPVTITSARIALGNRSGADLVLRIGNAPALARLRPVAHANGAGGVIRLKTAPTRGRYVLVWFTKLPPDQAGTYQVSVYDIKLRGNP